MAVRLLKQSKSFGGVLQHYAHESTATNSSMRFSMFLPAKALAKEKVPVIYFLAGATRNEETFMSFGGAQRFAAARGVALVAPDTSPRISQGSSHWAYGPGASWYVDATQPRWTKHYNMQTYVSQELPALIQSHFPILSKKQSIMGHSMGGHGALITSLRNPDVFKSVSAFAPACNPTYGEYGSKAFKNYLGADQTAWKEWDATYLVLDKGPTISNILIDFGTLDEFWCEQNDLHPEEFIAACEQVKQPLNFRWQDGYDHSWDFVATFMEDHINYHADILLEN